MKALRSTLPLLACAVFCRPAGAQDSAQTRPPVAAARRASTDLPAVAGRTRIPALRLEKRVLCSGEQLAGALLWLLRALRVAVLLLVLFLALPVIFAASSWMRPWADRVRGLVLTPLGQIWSAFAFLLEIHCASEVNRSGA